MGLKVSILNEHGLTIYTDVEWIKFDDDMSRIYFKYDHTSAEVSYLSADAVLVDDKLIFKCGEICRNRVGGFY